MTVDIAFYLYVIFILILPYAKQKYKTWSQQISSLPEPPNLTQNHNYSWTSKISIISHKITAKAIL